MSAPPPYLRRRQQHKIGKAGRASEKRMSRILGGTPTPASGALEGAKGDLNLDSFLMECKSTIKDSIQIKFAWLAKIAHEAQSMGKKPALTVSFTLPDGTAIRDGDWIMVPRRVWEDSLK